MFSFYIDLEEVQEDELNNNKKFNDNLLTVGSPSCLAAPQSKLLRQRAISCDVPETIDGNLTDDSHFEDLLMRNIKIWKFSGNPNTIKQFYPKEYNDWFTKRVKSELAKC